MRMRKLIIKKFLKKEVFLVSFLIFLFLLGGTLIAGNKFFSLDFLAKGQTIPLFYFPRFPTRLAGLVSEIKIINEELVKANENLLNSVSEFDCQYAQSQCIETTRELPGGGKQAVCEPGPLKVFGSFSPPPLNESGDVEEITLEKQQATINNLNKRLAILQEILEGEINVGLEKQLKTLKPEDAQFIRESLEEIRERLPEMKNLAERNSSLPNNCSVSRCLPDCQLAQTFTAEACFGYSSEQKPIELKFKIKVGLDDIKLGRVGVENINLSLPDTVQLPTFQLPSFTFSIPNITLTCPTQKQQIRINPPTPRLPQPGQIPQITFKCPLYPGYSDSANCSTPSSPNEKGFIEFEWWNNTFQHLSNECLKVVQKGADITGQLRNERGQQEYQRLVAGCLNPNQVVPTLINECEKWWVEIPEGSGFWRILRNGDFEICRQIGHKKSSSSPRGEKRIINSREEKAIEWCQRLFQEEGQNPPSSCLQNPIATLGQKCNEIRDSGRQETPLACKLLPLFLGRLDNPPSGNIKTGGGTCSAKTIGDFPFPFPGCQINFSSVPKIVFPSIVIPDIHLPSFSFPPLFRVKLPNLIIEDLNLGTLELCNLDNCQAQFPFLSFRPPIFRIPQIEIPPLSLEIPGASPIDILVGPINFPQINFNLPQLINLNSLITPELKIPEFSLPQPRIEFSFLGLNIDLLNLLLGLLAQRFDLPPNFNQCIKSKGHLGILDIVYPDHFIGWPAFPRPGELEICKRANEWCKRQRSSIEEISQKAEKIQEKVDEVFQKEIQSRLDKAANKLNQKIREELENHLQQVKEEISRQLYNHLRNYAPQNILPPPAEFPGVWEIAGEIPCQNIPPLTVILPDNLKNFTIEPGKIEEFLQRELRENWPSEIRLEFPDNLKRFKLSCNEQVCNSCEERGDEECKRRFLRDSCPSFKAWQEYAKCKIEYRFKNCKNECKNCLSFELPSLPLCRLSYEKEFTRRLPGHQVSVTVPRDLLSGLRNARQCISRPPKGGNPCQREKEEIQTNLERMKTLKEEVANSAQKIYDRL